jgi:hypothetical protein
MERVLIGRTGKPVGEERVEVPLTDLIWEGRAKQFQQPQAEIGTRVVVIAAVGPVEFGETGTVVAVDVAAGVYSILLDKRATYGTTLRKRLQSKRGYTAKGDDLFFG